MEKLAITEIAAALGAKTVLSGWIRKICTDSRIVEPGCLFVAIVGESKNGHEFVASALTRGAVAAVVSEEGDWPPERVFRVPDTKDAYIRLAALVRRQYTVRTVAVTGSVGKTTTKEYIAAALSARYITHKTLGNNNNEIGLPNTVFALSGAHEALVVELGMSGLGEIAKLAAAVRPELGVITNIGVSHLEHLGSRENIRRAKLELADALPDGAPLLLCGDDDMLAQVKIPRLRILTYGFGAGNDVRAESLGEEEGATLVRFSSPWGEHTARIPAVGRHNVLDAAAGFAVGCLCEVEPAAAAKALAAYRPAGMRQHELPWHGATLVMDCYNAAPASMEAALTTLASWKAPEGARRIAVLGDMLELGPISEEAHRQVGRMAAGLHIDALYCYGPLAPLYAQGAAEQGLGAALCTCDKRLLCDALCDTIRPGDVVWFKASRGIELEQVIQLMTDKGEGR